MHEMPELEDVRTAWMNQPGTNGSKDVDLIRTRRTQDLFSTTRYEILATVGSALFFACILAWRIPSESNQVFALGCVGVVVWAALTMWRYRVSIRRRSLKPEALASTGVEHYRAELLRRQDHLRSASLFHGPLLLALILSLLALPGSFVLRRIWAALPVALVLAWWAVAGVKRRQREVAQLQRELDEI